MDSCVIQSDVQHSWIAQRQVDHVTIYCNGVGRHVLCLRHGIRVCSTLIKVSLLQIGTVTV